MLLASLMILFQSKMKTPPTPSVCLLFVDLQGVFSLWSLLYGSVLHAFLGGEYLGISRLHTCLSVCSSVHTQQAHTCMHMIIAYRHIYLCMHAYLCMWCTDVSHACPHTHACTHTYANGNASPDPHLVVYLPCVQVCILVCWHVNTCALLHLCQPVSWSVHLCPCKCTIGFRMFST